MFAFFHLGVEEMTVLLAFGGIVVVPLIVGIVVLSMTCKADRQNHPM